MTILKSQLEIRRFVEKISKLPHFKKGLLGGLVFGAVFLLLVIWIYHQLVVSTDDAYINADIVQISPQVSGQVIHVYVTNNQFVKKGQLLFEVDPIPYLIAVDRAKAQLSLARKIVAEKSAAVTAAQAEVAVRTAEWHAAQSTAARTLQLVHRKVLSQQAGDDATANYQKATAALDAAKANLSQAQITLGKADDTNEQILLAKTNLRDAQLNLSYTQVRAPNNGIVANLVLRTGSLVTSHQLLFALISTEKYWVDTNLKETDLKNIHIGQKADIILDMYPNFTFKGIVESISGGSGTAFSIFPPPKCNWQLGQSHSTCPCACTGCRTKPKISFTHWHLSEGKNPYRFYFITAHKKPI